jgi:hypothetical protein
VQGDAENIKKFSDKKETPPPEAGGFLFGERKKK